MTYLRAVLVVFLCLSFVQIAEAKKPSKNPFIGVHNSYSVAEIGSLNIGDFTQLTMERATTYGYENSKVYPMNRIQFRDKDGFIVAYTPTRGQAIPLCYSADMCLVFMWKTVYPLPAIFKFKADPPAWIRQNNPPMIYSRSGNDGRAFTDVTNPFLGLFGLGLFIVVKIWYFAIVIMLSFLLLTQIIKFHDLPEERKSLWFKVCAAFNAFTHTYIPIEPYAITVAVLIIYQNVGVMFWGIPTTHTFGFSIAAFLIGAILLAKMKAKRAV
tara:strand:+ start:31202 stop:32008 length:807 start_codon:yes stop_codon:yes gene_type:complete